VVAVRPAYLDLVFHVVDARWRFFFNAPPDVQAARHAYLAALLQALAHALQGTDLEAFQLALRHLQRLNEVHKLYQRVRVCMSTEAGTGPSLMHEGRGVQPA
jgi:hypothetical protein